MKKSGLKIFLLSLLTFFVIINFNFVEAASKEYYYTTTISNYRNAPNGEILGTFRKNLKLYLEDVEGSNWKKGNFNGTEIFVYNGNLSKNPIIIKDYYYTNTITNYRSAPNGKILGTFRKNLKLYLEDIEGSNWKKGNFKGTEIFIYNANLSKTPVATKEYYYTNTISNYRNKPNGDILGTFRINTKLYLAQSSNSNWFYGHISGKEIYIYKSNLSKTPVASQDPNKTLSEIDKDGNGIVTIQEALDAGFTMPIYKTHWLYKYMIDRNNNGMVGEN